MLKTTQYIFLFAFSMLYFFPILHQHLGVFDEGVILVGADRILKGEMPFTDFFSVYPPGQYCLLAILFKIFGSTLLVERIYDCLVKSGIAIFSYLITKKVTSNEKTALVSWVLTLVWLGHRSLAVYPVYPSLLFIAMATYVYLHFLENNNAKILIVCSILLMVSALFRHDLAGYTAFTVLFSLLIQRRITRGNFSPIKYYCTTFIAFALPVILFIIIYSDPKEVIDQLLLTPIVMMSKFRWMPYPDLSMTTLAFYAFPLILMFGCFVSMFQLLCMKNTKYQVIFLFSFIGILFLNQAKGRSDIYHLLPLAYSAVVLLPLIWGVIFTAFPERIKRFSQFVTLLVFGIVFIDPIHSKVFSISSNYLSINKRNVLSSIEYQIVDEHLINTILFIQKNTEKTDSIYVGVNNHDHLLINHSIIYFLAQRRVPTRYHQFDPGIITTKSVQTEMIADLEIAKPKIAVLTPSASHEPNQSRFDTNVNVLDKYIQTKYRFDKNYGLYSIWIRN